jgi:hypothetical protein
MALDATKRSLATASHAPPSPRSYWVVPAWLLAGAYPSTPDAGPERTERVSALFRAGIRTFVNLVEEDERAWGKPFAPYVGDLDAIASAVLRASCIRFPVPDGGIPSVSGMRSILDTIDLSLEAGRPVYVHCFGGMGRTATAVGCWLMRHGLASKRDVLDVITRLRQADDERRDRDAPENDPQRAFVKAWAEGS